MNYCFTAASRHFILLLLVIIAPVLGRAAMLSYQTSNPTPGQYWIYNFTGATQDRNNVGGNGTADGTGNDTSTYIASNRPQQGQTFTTGTALSAYTINAVWIYAAGYSSSNTVATFWQVANGQSLTVRITNPAQAGNAFFVVASENVTSTGTEVGTPNALANTAGSNSVTGPGVWVRLALTTPITLQPNTQYGFDITSLSGSLFFETAGIRDAAPGGNPYTGGNAYRGSTNGTPDFKMNALTGDRVFAVELAPVLPFNSTPNVQATAFTLDRIRLLTGRFKSNQDLDRTGLLDAISPDSLLWPYRNNANMTQPAGAQSLGGWEGGANSAGFTAVRGHMAGHWLSASSKMYAMTGDAQLLANIQTVVTDLAQVQAVLATGSDSAGRSLNGYLAAFPISFFETLETNPTSAQVPFYTVHKIMAGLVDAYRYAGINQALDMAIAMSDYHSGRMARLTQAQVEAMFIAHTGETEWGGMNEVLTDIYQLSLARGDSNPQRHLAFAQYFHRDWFLTPLYMNTDILNGLHANTHIPQVVGFAREAGMRNASDPERTSLYTSADNFWHMVVNNHWLVNGGNSYSEHFAQAGLETGVGGSALTVATAETCNVYNMLKLSNQLFQYNPQAEYMDFYEHALYNQILAGLAPDTGMFTYFQPMISGFFKTYSERVGSAWCCMGTGMENPSSSYGQSIYYHSNDILWVNLYIPSTVNWSENGMSVELDTGMPASGTSQLTFTCSQPTEAKIRLRIPSWIAGAPTITVNGAVQNITATANSYAEIDRTWSNGDTIGITLPMGLRLDRSMDDATQVSIFYGPVLMAGQLGTAYMPASDQAAGQLDYSAMATAPAPLMVAPDSTNLSSWVSSGTAPLNFTASVAYSGSNQRSSIQLLPYYDTHHVNYAVYWSFIAPGAFSTWSGGGTDTHWSTITNWNATPAATNGLRFAAAAGGQNSNDIAVGTHFDGIQFMPGAGPFVIGGNSIALEGDVVNSSSNSQEIDLPITLGENLPWQFNTASAGMVLGGALGGTGILDKLGPYTLTLLGNSTFAGSVLVAGGSLQVGNGGTSGSLTAGTPIVLANGATINFDRADNVSVTSAISGTGCVILSGSGQVTLYGQDTHTGPVLVQSGTFALGSTQLQPLLHRWSFNGNLNDSIGTSTATIVSVGANAATVTASNVTMTGGAQASSNYVQLGSNLLPQDGTPATIELWATQNSFETWSRIFDFGSSNSQYIMASWDQTAAANDRVEWKQTVTNTVDNTDAPYTNGVEYHIAFVIAPGAGANGTTRVTWYAAPATSASLGAARGTFDTTNSMATLAATNFWLGRSEYSGDATASASYDEVRIWNRTFTASQLNDLHQLGPDSLGSYATETLSGGIPSTSDVAVASGGAFNLAGISQSVASLSGSAGSTFMLGGGQLNIAGGGNNAATFGGAFAGTGSIINNGILRLVGNASFPAGVTLVNNGTLDLLTWQGTLPTGFINNGTVITRSSLVIKSIAIASPDVQVSMQGYAGHNFQLQTSTVLTSGSWSNIGSPVPGADAPIMLVHPGGAAGASRCFYRVTASP